MVWDFDAILPAFNFCVLPLVLRNGGLAEVCFTSKFKAHFYRTEKICASFIAVLQWGHDVCRTGQGLEELDLLERVRHRVTALETVAISEQDLYTLVVIPLGSEHNGAGVDLQSSHSREWPSSIDKLSGLITLAPLENRVEGVWLLLHGGTVHRLLHQLRCVGESFYFLVTLQIF